MSPPYCGWPNESHHFACVVVVVEVGGAVDVGCVVVDVEVWVDDVGVVHDASTIESASTIVMATSANLNFIFSPFLFFARSVVPRIFTFYNTNTMICS